MVWQIRARLDSPASFLEAILLVIGLIHSRTIVMGNADRQLGKV